MGTRLSAAISRREKYGQIIDRLLDRWSKEEDAVRIDRIARVGDWYAVEYRKLIELIDTYKSK